MANRPFKKPDVTAPRLRLGKLDVLKHKRKDTATGKNIDFYTRLKLVYPSLEQYTNRRIKQLINRCNKEVIMKQILYTREGAELPGNLGHVFLGTGPVIREDTLWGMNSCINKKVSTELEEIRKYANPHTDGNVARIYYTNNEVKIRFENAKYWTFRAAQAMKRQACKAYSENWRIYFHVRKNNFISSFIRDTRALWKKALPMYFGEK